MTKRTVVICIDGFDPEYLEACRTPNLRELGRKGFLKIGRSMMPSVTNVNNVSLCTASYPEKHGISSNYRLVRETGEEIYMESAEYILAETMFEKAARLGKKSVVVTSKDKLRTLLNRGPDITVSSERPLDWIVEGIGEPPKIYSLEVNGWVIRAGDLIMSRMPEVELVYLTTTDYAMHTYAPDEPESQQHLSILDDAIGDLVTHHPDATLMLTADHGMSQKTRMVDLKAALGRYGIAANPVPIIKDRYTVHHSNLGGFMFVYLDDVSQMAEAVRVLSETPGVEYVKTRDEAARDLRLHYDRIGDLVVNGAPEVVFGDPGEVGLPPRLRSHASTHEQDIPLLGYNGDFAGFDFEENRDLGRYVVERVLG
jgi:phosphonoacetate hydrolase